MKDRRRWEGSRCRPGHYLRPPPLVRSWFSFFVLACVFAALFAAYSLFADSFHPILASNWQQPPAMKAVSGQLSISGGGGRLHLQEAISFPDQLLFFLKYPSHTSPIPASDLLCLYYAPSAPSPDLRLPAISHSPPLARCPPAPRGFSVSLHPSLSPPLAPRQWDHLAYAAVFDPLDNSTILFAKGLNLRSGRLSDPARYECFFGWDFSNPKYLLPTIATSAAQEIIRCETPLSVIRRHSSHNPPLVSVKPKFRGATTLPSVAHPIRLLPPHRKLHSMCVCTMLRNQARFLPEWLIYHARIGVQRWFIYDNNSDDDIEQVIASLSYNVTLHDWPWVKSQEAGFAHCALRARGICEWVGFIDVDEFLYLPRNHTLHAILRNYSSQPWVGELRTPCHSFGPSGHRTSPAEGVTAGYTCRMAAPERHKSIVRPDTLNPSLVNVVHHFHLKNGMRYVNIERGMVVNHYKYQAWEVFKEKFFRRVATYVADWQDDENVGSKDRAPGLGTKAVEPPDWPTRFCEVNDTGMRNWVLRHLRDRHTGLLPWEQEQQQ